MADFMRGWIEFQEAGSEARICASLISDAHLRGGCRIPDVASRPIMEKT